MDVVPTSMTAEGWLLELRNEIEEGSIGAISYRNEQNCLNTTHPEKLILVTSMHSVHPARVIRGLRDQFVGEIPKWRRTAKTLRTEKKMAEISES